MKLLITTIVIFLSGCMSKIPKLTPAPNSPQPIHQMSFEDIDENKDGDITQQEFNKITKHPETNIHTPIIWFIVLIALVGSMVSITRLIKNDKGKNNG